MLMPLILYVDGRVIFGKMLQESLSMYYHTGMRAVMVGILFALGVFLFSYKGYGREDDVAGNLACLFAIETALFPTLRDGETGEVYKRISVVHRIFAPSPNTLRSPNSTRASDIWRAVVTGLLMEAQL